MIFFILAIHFFLVADCWSFPIKILGVDLCEFDVLGVVCRCPLRVNMIEETEKLLNENLFGQDQSKEMLINALRLHNFAGGNKATVIHIAGDNGVGKTMATNLIAQAAFRKTANGQPDGYLYIRGNSYRGDVNIEEREKYRARLEQRLVRQLIRCPHSIIIIDEVELMHSETIHVFQQFLDTSNNLLEIYDKNVMIDRAIYFFISDFGIEGRTEGMSLEKIQELIHKDSLIYWQDIKTSALVQHIVPFLPQSTIGVKNFVKHLLQNLRNHHTLNSQKLTVVQINYSQANLEAIINLIDKKSNSRLTKFKNYRGVAEVFDELVTTEFLKSISSYRDMAVNVDISLSYLSKVIVDVKQTTKLNKEI